MQVAEVVGISNGEFIVEEIFGFEQTGVDSRKRAIGEFYTSGYKPMILSRIHAAGIELPPDMLTAKRHPEPTASIPRPEVNGRQVGNVRAHT
jgi:pilus assembly protein CpaF